MAVSAVTGHREVVSHGATLHIFGAQNLHPVVKKRDTRGSSEVGSVSIGYRIHTRRFLYLNTEKTEKKGVW